MEEQVREQLGEHMDYIASLEQESYKGKEEMEDFIKFLTKKIQTEKGKTAHLQGLFNFNTKNLDNSPFSDIVNAMKRKSKNEVEQYQSFVENLVNDVAYPFKDSMILFETKSKKLFSTIKADIFNLFNNLDRFKKIRWQYEDSSEEFVKSILSYINFKLQATEASSTTYKQKLFETVGNKLLNNEDKTSDLVELNEEINDFIDEYLEKLAYFKKEYHSIESERFQSIVDAINRTVIFETS